jgi:PIN domain nuclease of toxin-antitoxin system
LAVIVVLDASAMLAVVQQEIGGEQVMCALEDSGKTLFVSSVNLSEVVTKLIRMGHSAAEVPISIEPFLKYVVDFDCEQALYAGELSRLSRPLGLSLGDRACLALAASRKATAWTTDSAWLKLKTGVKIHLLRG